jgi:hypothetical protein
MTQTETIFRLQGNFSSDELAKHTKAYLKNHGIKSPDTTKMYQIKRGKTTYFYHNKEKYLAAKNKFSIEDAILRERKNELVVEPDYSKEDEKTLELVRDNNYKCKDCVFMAKNDSKHFICTSGHRTAKRIKNSMNGCEKFSLKID